MPTKVRTALVVLTAGALLLAGCEAEVQTVMVTAPPEEVVIAVTVPPEVVLVSEEPFPGPESGSQHPPQSTPELALAWDQGGGRGLPAIPQRPNRLIVKDAEMTLVVANTDIAIDRTTQIVADVGGYIISSRVWYQEWLGENHKYASITLAVPVDQFERALRRLRDLAVRVLNEAAAGQDVTDEYVDLESRLGNLEATRDRLRGLMDEARTVQAALEVNEELTAIEEQIELVQGRMNYISDRAAYSTITVQIEPELPPATPTPVPSWSAAHSFGEASHDLGATLRVLADLVIRFGVAVVPFLAPPLLVAWAIWRRIRRRRT
jgi:hypothetical protein